jgi:diguanylate cyclase (GGDEF)-like protein/PAS domain S-box-containing protein
MSKVYDCIATAHDLRLVVLAVIICAMASSAAISLQRHASVSIGSMRQVWLGVAAVSAGFGIWATHFIAMLAFSPGIPSGYNIALTLISLVAAILLTGAGLATSMLPNWRAGPWLGGGLVGGGIAVMHYTGMAAFEIQGTIVWDKALVVGSIALGAIIGATALPAALQAGRKWKYIGAALLTLAIASHHFTAMGAVSIVPDPTIAIPPVALPTGLMALGVAMVSLAIILLAFAGVYLDIRDQRRSELEASRMQGLADAAVEGLVLCDEGKIVTVNNSFTVLCGIDRGDIVSRQLADCFPNLAAHRALPHLPSHAVETNLRHGDGILIPVEIIIRPMEYAGRAHQVIAVRDLRARKQAEQHIRYLAHHDALTSLPNRSHFNTRLDQAIAQSQSTGEAFAVLCLDLDRFKEINDLFGHAAGDSVLQTVAARTTALLDDSCVMARLGGDEFAILMPGIRHASAAGRMAEKILAALQAADEQSDVERISCSIGIAICPDDAIERQTLLTQADTALYRAKTDGRATFRFFETNMGIEVRLRRELEHDLRQAALRNEFKLVFQPQQDLQNNKATGFEALLRWRHPVRGDISPTVFIPIAEETGAIIDIGVWVLRQACREATSWSQPLTVAVNVSAVQLHSPSFVQTVHSILLETGLSPRRLELEITETALIRDLNRALVTLRQLKALGVQIAMDDFGTGYSSLSNLRAFPFDKIKIDGSFVKSVHANAAAATIVRAVLGLGRGLGLPVLAEGVETGEELHFLQSEGCNAVQGYLLGRPSEISAFRNMTHDEPAPPAETATDAEPPRALIA